MGIECLIFIENDDTPIVFKDIDLAVSHAVQLFENGVPFDVVPASRGFITEDRQPTSLGQDFGEDDEYSPTQFDQSAADQIDAWISNRYRMHFDPESGNFGPRQYHKEYALYMNKDKLYEAFVPAVEDGHIDLHIGKKMFPAPEPGK